MAIRIWVLRELVLSEACGRALVRAGVGAQLLGPAFVIARVAAVPEG